MAKASSVTKGKVVDKVPKNILITQPRPESPKSPYFELEKKYGVVLHFQPFITLQGIDSKEFRKQRIDLSSYSAFILTSKNAIDHLFRVCDEMKIKLDENTKYFCITEAVALYLQKFINYKKRKVFYGSDGTNKSMFDVVNKHKDNERFVYPCSENQQDGDIMNWLKANNCGYALAFLYRTISTDVKELLAKTPFDVMCFFTPSGVKSLFENAPKFKQNGTKIGAFGNNTTKTLEEAGLELAIKAPMPNAPSMIAALDKYLASVISV